VHDDGFPTASTHAQRTRQLTCQGPLITRHANLPAHTQPKTCNQHVGPGDRTGRRLQQLSRIRLQASKRTKPYSPSVQWHRDHRLLGRPILAAAPSRAPLVRTLAVPKPRPVITAIAPPSTRTAHDHRHHDHQRQNSIPGNPRPGLPRQNLDSPNVHGTIDATPLPPRDPTRHYLKRTFQRSNKRTTDPSPGTANKITPTREHDAINNRIAESTTHAVRPPGCIRNTASNRPSQSHRKTNLFGVDAGSPPANPSV